MSHYQFRIVSFLKKVTSTNTFVANLSLKVDFFTVIEYCIGSAIINSLILQVKSYNR